jgi:hypothetical protein
MGARREATPSGRGSVPRKGANGPALRSLLYEEAVSFSLSTFTLDIDGKPMLVLRAKWQADADEICRAWVQAHWGEFTRQGPYGTELPPAIRLRMARAAEKAAFEANAHSALLFHDVYRHADRSRAFGRASRQGASRPMILSRAPGKVANIVARTVF